MLSDFPKSEFQSKFTKKRRKDDKRNKEKERSVRRYNYGVKQCVHNNLFCFLVLFQTLGIDRHSDTLIIDRPRIDLRTYLLFKLLKLYLSHFIDEMYHKN